MNLQTVWQLAFLGVVSEARKDLEKNMAVEILTATLSNADDAEVTLSLGDKDGADVGTLTIARDVWDELDDDIDTIVVDGVIDIEVE